ncbi:FUSC family protein [Paractinoplanes atraurantiacus]|uniref:FUSC family protein n=1 Tax=Paractinoplanes atraurantiacus TaxID=1036182 RepID=UPI001177DFE4|nr:FUSC family protein [Actinoplanes atraurantiacus]
MSPATVPHDLRAAVRVRPADAAWAFAFRAGLAVAVPLVVLIASGHTAWAGVATFGAFTALYGRDEPYRRRAVIVAFSAAGLVASVVMGTLAALAPHPEIVGVAVIALIGGAATLLCNRYRVGPPAGLMFAFAAAVASALPATASSVPRNAALTAAAAAVAWLIVMSGALVAPDAPRRLAVARALRAAAALHTAPAGPPGLQARQQAALAVDRAWRAVAAGRWAAAGASAGPGDELRAEEILVAHAENELSGVHGRSAEVAAELRALAARVGPRGPIPRLRATPAENARIAERRLGASLLRDLPTPGPGTPRRPLWPAAARVAFGALIAGAAAGVLVHVTGLSHPYWAAVSAVAVLQTASLRLSTQKAIQRAGGTIVGLLLAGLVVSIPGGPWMMVAGIVLLQVVAELLVIRNYGLAMLAITPLALLVGELGHQTPPLDLIGDRLVQTVLGSLLGLAAALLVRNRAANRYLAEAVTAVEIGTDALRRDPADPMLEARRLALLVATLREAYDVAAGEPGLQPEITARVLEAEKSARDSLAVLTHPNKAA